MGGNDIMKPTEYNKSEIIQRERSFQYKVSLRGKEFHYRKHLPCRFDRIQGEMNSPQQDKKGMVIVYIHKHHQEIYDNLDRKMVFQWLGDLGVRKLDSPIIPFSPRRKSKAW